MFLFIHILLLLLEAHTRPGIEGYPAGYAYRDLDFGLYMKCNNLSIPAQVCTSPGRV